jgi:hypothetical protein
MMLLGLIWAVAAPLLLLVPGWLIFALLSFTDWSRPVRIAAASVIVAAIVGTAWWSDYREFVSVCEGAGKPRIYMRSTADGIYLDSPTANSFGMNYLHQQGFSWMEMRSIYDRTRFERVSRTADGQLRTDPIDAVSARYEVRETFEQPHRHTSLSMRYVIDRQSAQVMARAGGAHFDGGRARWVLGAYGTRSYPSAMTNSKDFNGYYYLAQHTLRPAPGEKPATGPAQK